MGAGFPEFQSSVQSWVGSPRDKFEKFEYINIIQGLNLIPGRAYTDNVGDVFGVGGTIHLLRQQQSSPPRLRLSN